MWEINLKEPFLNHIYNPKFNISNEGSDQLLLISDRYIDLYEEDVPEVVKSSPPGSILRDIERFKIRYNIDRFKKWLSTFKKDEKFSSSQMKG